MAETTGDHPAAPVIAALAARLHRVASADHARRFFTPHQAAVVEDATARIAPGPQDDPAEKGHPGAREADVTGYIDTMLAALADLGDSTDAADDLRGRSVEQPAHLGPGPDGPLRRPGPGGQDRLAQAPDRAGRTSTTKGIEALDKLAGGDFTQAGQDKQDKILATQSVSTFTSLLFEHTIEGLYASPEYGGNRGRSGWKEIGFPGDIQPRGYTADEVERSDGHDPVEQSPVIADVVKLLGVV